MTYTNKTNERTFVYTAITASKLNAIVSIGHRLHLSALNAKIATASAGEIGRGFRPLTEFVSELTRETIEIVEKINKEALLISFAAVKHLRITDNYNRLDKAVNLYGEEGEEETNIKKLSSQAINLMESEESIISTHLTRLSLLMREIELKIRTAKFISSNCRVEAAQITEFRDKFETVATTIENSGEQIGEIVSDCKKLLRLIYN